MTFMNEESHVMSFLGAGWVNGALQPSDAPFVLMGECRGAAYYEQAFSRLSRYNESNKRDMCT